MSVASLNLNEIEQRNQSQQVNPSITNPFLMTDVKESGDKYSASILSLLQVSNIPYYLG